MLEIQQNRSPSYGELSKYLLQSLNMALQITGETSYTNSFDIKLSDEGITFIPRLPSSYLIDDELYNKIYLICNAALYPLFTVLRQPSAYFIPVHTDDFHTMRALFFPWKIGISKRLIIPDLESFSEKVPQNIIPIMENLSVNYDKITSIAISGTSGGGKSYFLTYLLDVIKRFSNIVIIDPKFDQPSRWARYNNVVAIHPEPNRSKSDFMSQISEVLSKYLNLIYERQQILFDNPRTQFKHETIVIEEALSLVEGVPKQIRDSYLALLEQISLMGRSSKVHLIIVSQRFEYTAVPLAVREQMNLLVQVGNINSSTTKFLFPDLNVSGVIIPTGKGNGLVQYIDAEQPYTILPLLTPTYKSQKEIL